MESRLGPLGRSELMEVVNSAVVQINGARRPGEQGQPVWIDPTTGQPFQPDLYYGTAGLTYFLSRLSHAAPDARSHDDDLRRMSSSLHSAAGAGRDTGLYSGLAGITLALHSAALALGDDEVMWWGWQARARLVEHCRAEADGPPTASLDLISGAAGVGLTAITLFGVTHDDAMVDLASSAADGILSQLRPGRTSRLARPAGHLPQCRVWRGPSDGVTSPELESSLTPWFAHGLSGMGFFLGRMYELTGRASYLEAAGRIGDDVMRLTGDLISDSDPLTRFRSLSWCGGLAGPITLCQILYRTSHDRSWLRALLDLGNAVLHQLRRKPQKSGVASSPQPESSPVDGPNFSRCCGLGGVLQLLDDLADTSGFDTYRRVANGLASYLVSALTGKHFGESHAGPGVLAGRGLSLMQGAAGIGLVLLRLVETSGPPVPLPDEC